MALPIYAYVLRSAYPNEAALVRSRSGCRP